MSTKIKEKLFLVNPNYREICGQNVTPNILAIKDPIDYAILVFPALVIPQVLE
jgi:acyl-CoA synthetase (NDP forming)